LSEAAETGFAVQLLQLDFIPLGFCFINVVKDFLGPERAINFTNGFQDLEAELGIPTREELLGSIRQPLGLFGAAHAFGAAPSIEITVPFQADAVLFDAHVREANPLAKFGDGKALTALDLPKYREFRVVVVLGK